MRKLEIINRKEKLWTERVFCVFLSTNDFTKKTIPIFKYYNHFRETYIDLGGYRFYLRRGGKISPAINTFRFK